MNTHKMTTSSAAAAGSSACAHVHWYGKTESRPGRSWGVTVRLDAQNRSEASAIAQTINPSGTAIKIIINQ